MPLNGRNPFALGLLSGNTTPMFGMGSNLPFIAGGGRFSANEVTLDGVDNNTVSNAGSIGRNGIAVVPSVDAVQEFKVKTSTFSAEFGHAAARWSTPPSRAARTNFTEHYSSFCATTTWTPIISSPMRPASPKLRFIRISLGLPSAARSSTTGLSSSPITRAPGKILRREARSPTCRRPLCGVAISPGSRPRSTIQRRAASGQPDS